MKPSKRILPIIVIAQFFCTSLWFAGNGVMSDLTEAFNLGQNALSHLSSIVQFGFIIGTLVFALLSFADRYSPSKVFFICALLGALFNLGIIWNGNTFYSILILRFFTGFFLAGIYPVGMKIAADYFEKGLGKSLGYLVGALVLGTAFPHLLKVLKGDFPWQYVLITTSVLASIGGTLLLVLVPNGPYRKASQSIQLTAIRDIFIDRKFRIAAFGYFGHMWELYAFWVFVPVIIRAYNFIHTEHQFDIALTSFFVIAIGSLACVIGGYLAHRFGTKRIATTALLLSCCCCIVSPLLFLVASKPIFFLFLLFWGMVVIADSPLFSTLVAQSAIIELKGTALTIVNSIGFFISIISIQLINELSSLTNTNYILPVLAIGPIIGLVALLRN